MDLVYETFAEGLGLQWKTHLTGAGRLEAPGKSLRFISGGASPASYTNAQIDDYQNLPRSRFNWTSPLRLSVRARFSHPAGQLRGTAGFGFWNDPLLMTQRRLPALPRAVWFFYASMPSDMKLDMVTPGHGWKVASIDAQRGSALLWAPLAPLLVPLMNLEPVYRALWPRIQRALRIREATIPVDMTQWQTYVLDWGSEFTQFSLGGHGAESSIILGCPSPSGPLGFVMWQDNQYLQLTPWGRLRWGLLETPDGQWMEVEELQIQPERAQSI